MEISNFPNPTIAPVRSPSAVEDGDSGPNSPHYRRRQKKKRTAQEQAANEHAPQLEGAPSRIDIHV
jgi:hypothetical protein